MRKIARVLVFPKGGHLWLVVCLLFGMTPAFAQSDTLLLQEVEVAAQIFARTASGIHIETKKTDDAFFSAGQTVGEWLNSRSALVMRGNGPGSSYGVSLRGGNSSQSQLLLNGIPFDNPSLAQADISLLPAAIFTDAALYRGSSGALLGNASVGGTIFLDTRLAGQEPGFRQTFTAGSFGAFGSSTVATYGRGLWQGRTAVYFQEAQNDFDRPHPHDRNRSEPQPEAYFRTRGLQQNLVYLPENGDVLDFSIWLNETNRKLPPTLSQLRSTESQNDQNARLQLGYLTRFGIVKIDSRVATDYGFLNYSNARSGLDDDSDFTTLHAQSSASGKTGKFTWNTTAIYRRSEAITSNYNRRELRESPALVAGVDYTFYENKSKIAFAGRAEWLNGQALPLLPSLGISHRMSELLSFRGSASRVYRLPGLNDLFWSPGGNPDLRPESGWSQELGFDLGGAFAKSRWTVSVTGFNRQIEDWIIWTPGAGYWSPVNLRKVWSRGGELHGSMTNLIGRWRLTHTAESTFARSTHTASVSAGEDRLIGKQLIYIPEWSNFYSEEIAFRQYSLIGLLHHQSARYTTTDNARQLDPYLIADLEALVKFDSEKFQFSASAAVRNLFDTDYQVAANRPMPGRYFTIGLSIHYKHNN